MKLKFMTLLNREVFFGVLTVGAIVSAQNLPFSIPPTFEINYQPTELELETKQACSSQYLKRLNVPGQMTIAVALGYSDTVDEGFDIVTDSFLLSTLDRRLTQPCEYDQQGFCEFVKTEGSAHSPTSYHRVLNVQGESVPVDIIVMNSSYDWSHRANQSTFKNEQQMKSERAREFYAWALGNADVVFYEGHSRDGGGPDFSPPHRASNGKVNYPWYRKNKPGLRFLLEAVRQATEAPMIFGLFSCASQGHFKSSITKALPQANSILSTRVVEAKFTKEALLVSLESILNFECSSTLHSRLRKSSFVVNRVF